MINITFIDHLQQATTVQAAVGTDDYYRASVDSNWRVSDLIAVRLNAMYHENDVPGRDVENFKRWGVAPSITIGTRPCPCMPRMFTSNPPELRFSPTNTPVVPWKISPTEVPRKRSMSSRVMTLTDAATACCGCASCV